ncbi:MAG: hypothetical protein HRU24_08745 [Gammaproteobacteria bacterium]|nr:hypothetical protein [Gammaproteobacteria bacterium]
MTPDLISLTLVFTAAFSAIFFATHYRIYRQNQGASLWMAALTLFPLALYFISYQHKVIFEQANYVGEVLMSLVLLLVSVGIRAFFEQHKKIWLHCLLFFTNVTAIFYFRFFEPNIDIHSILMNLYIIIMFSIILFSLLLAHHKFSLFSRTLLSSVSIVVILLMSLSIYGHINPAAISANTVFVFFAAVGFLSHYGFCLGFCLLYSERNVEQISEHQQMIFKLEKIMESLSAQQINVPEKMTKPELITEPPHIETHNESETAIDPTIEAESNLLINKSEEKIDDPVQSLDLVEPQFLNITSLRWQQSSLSSEKIELLIAQLPELLNQAINHINQFNLDKKIPPAKESLRKLAINADKLGLEQLAELTFTYESNLPAEINKTAQEKLFTLGQNSIQCLKKIIGKTSEHGV